MNSCESSCLMDFEVGSRSACEMMKATNEPRSHDQLAIHVLDNFISSNLDSDYALLGSEFPMFQCKENKAQAEERSAMVAKW